MVSWQDRLTDRASLALPQMNPASLILLSPRTVSLLETASPEKGRHPHRIIPWLAAACFLVAASPVLGWYAQRVTDGSDEPLGVIALLAAIVLLVSRFRQASERAKVTFHPDRWLGGALLLVLLQATPLAHFPLIPGVVAIVIIGFSVRLPTGKSGLLALLVLSLPLVASLDFYAGYPLRLAASHLAVLLLNLGGLGVERAGVLLLDSGNVVGMDPPCAGVRMLWTACFTAAIVAARQRLPWQRTLLLLGFVVVCVVLGNSVRAALVFFPESGRAHWPDWAHSGVGLVVHAAVLGAIFAGGDAMMRKDRRKSGPIRTTSGESGWRVKSCVLIVCAVVVGLMVAHFPQAEKPLAGNTPWPNTLDGAPLLPLPLTTREARFAQAFPGLLGKFRSDDAEVILRRVAGATRLMHPAADCLRASGYSITTKPAHRDAQGRLWGCAYAERGGTLWRVRERYTNASGTRVSTDASAWFWEAMLHPAEGPWTAVTVIEALPDEVRGLAVR